MPFEESSKRRCRPAWIKVRASWGDEFLKTHEVLRTCAVRTVCVAGECPNIGECWGKRYAAFMLMGDICTRACKFCAVKTGAPNALDGEEPRNVANAVAALALKHVVLTSVTRDDLEDGGAQHYVDCIMQIRNKSPLTTIEILTPDFLHQKSAIDKIIRAVPEVFNHNIDTVPSLYKKVRPGGNYSHALALLAKVKRDNRSIFTKSGIMLGLGENEAEVIQVMDDLSAASVDFMTISQYLPPTLDHLDVDRYVSLEEFHYYKRIALARGFSRVAAGPLVRSSYHAEEDFSELRKHKIE